MPMHEAAILRGTCHAPRWEDFDGPMELCDRERGHLGRHAAWRLEGKHSRLYWPRVNPEPDVQTHVSEEADRG
jgi:hypothetical protein